MTYDPSEAEDRPKSSHVSLKDVRIIALVLIVLIVLGWPLYIRFREIRDKHVCKQNLPQIGKALLLYADDNTGRLPPVYVMGDGSEPRLFKGRASTWISLIESSVAKPQDTFRCPAAHEDELSPNVMTGNDTILASYGMFGALSAAALSNIPLPGSQVMIAESANQGGNGTYDPMRLKGPDGKETPDGFLIGFDNSNFLPEDSDMAVFAKSNWATRLAFPGTATGLFAKDGDGRHVGGIHVLFADNHIETVPPTFAKIIRAPGTGEIIKGWAIR